MSGGDDRRSFFLSGCINNNNGFVTGTNDTYKRSTVRLKASQLIGDKLKVGGNVSYIDTRGSFIQRSDNTSGIMLGGLRTPPEWNNIDFIASHGQYKHYRFQTQSTLSAPKTRGYAAPLLIMTRTAPKVYLIRVLWTVNIHWEQFS